MSENAPDTELQKQAIVFHSTTLENFVKCVVRGEDGIIFDSNGNVFYDKKKQPEFVEPLSTQVLPQLNRLAVHYAAQRARELHHTPLILVGLVDSNSLNNKELPLSASLKVCGFWIPKDENNWDDPRLESDQGFGDHFLNTYQNLDPKTFIEKIKKLVS